MKNNEQMEVSILNWNKENCLNYNNTLMRKKNVKNTTGNRPATPLFEATFNPFPQKVGFSIPLIVSKRRNADSLASISDCNDLKEGLVRMSLKQKPVIAKSNKLKDFFTHESSRYKEVQSRQKTNHRRLRGMSLNALSIRRDSLQEIGLPANPCATIEEARKQQFQKLYLRQRQAYQRILAKYGVIQGIEDEEFNKFMQSD